MTPDQQAFLQAIRETPDDDAPRLVYADLLEERGILDRAEFIRVQVEMARFSAQPRAPGRWQELLCRETALLEAHGDAWRQELPAWARQCVHFERGFAGYLICSAYLFLDEATELFQTAPIQRAWLRHDADDYIEALAHCDEVSRLAELDLSFNYLNNNSATQLASSPYLGRLILLTLSCNAIGDQGAAVLAAARQLDGIGMLDLRCNSLGDEGRRVLRARFGKRVLV